MNKKIVFNILIVFIAAVALIVLYDGVSMTVKNGLNIKELILVGVGILIFRHVKNKSSDPDLIPESKSKKVKRFFTLGLPEMTKKAFHKKDQK